LQLQPSGAAQRARSHNVLKRDLEATASSFALHEGAGRDSHATAAATAELEGPKRPT
jgi:hypothetical protein